MRKSLGIVLVPAALLIAVFSLLTLEPGARFSFMWATNAAIGSVVLLAPLTAGVSAMDAVRLRRTGSLELVSSLPLRQALLAHLKRAATIAAWAATGLALSAVACGAVALLNDSPPNAKTVVPIVLATLGCFAYSLIAYPLGLLAPYWLTPPLVTVGFYLIELAGLLYGDQDAWGFAGATGGNVAWMSVRPTMALAYAGFYLTLGLLGTAAIALVVAPDARRGVVTAACAVAVAASWLWMANSVSTGIYVNDASASWPCVAIGSSGSTVCLPNDQRRDLQVFGESLEGIDASFHNLDPTLGPITYTPQQNEDPRAATVEPPFGQETDMTNLVDQAVLGLTSCWPDIADRTDNELMSVLSAETVVAAWTYPPYAARNDLPLDIYGITTWPPTREDAQSSLTFLRSC